MAKRKLLSSEKYGGYKLFSFLINNKFFCFLLVLCKKEKPSLEKGINLTNNTTRVKIIFHVKTKVM